MKKKFYNLGAIWAWTLLLKYAISKEPICLDITLGHVVELHAG